MVRDRPYMRKMPPSWKLKPARTAQHPEVSHRDGDTAWAARFAAGEAQAEQ